MSQPFASDGQSIGASASISPFNKYSGLISFRIDWFYLLAVQWSLQSLLQQYSLKVSILQHSHIHIAAAAKLHQSCLTLCNPIDGSPLGSSVPGILQARTLERVAISFSNDETEK